MVRPSMRTLEMLCLLKKVTVQQLKVKETEPPSPDLVRGPLRSQHLDRKGPLCPSFRASVNLHHAPSGCRGFMAPISQDQGVQSLHFRKRMSPTMRGQGGPHRPGLSPRRGPFLPYSQGHTDHLPTGTAGAPRPLTLVGPEEQHLPNLKNARIPTEKKGSSRTPRTTRWQVLLLSSKDQNKPSSWGAGAWHLSSLGAQGGLCSLSLKGPEEGLLPLSLGVREDHPQAILWAQGGHILISLKDPEAKHPISCRDPGGCSLSSLKSKG